MLERYVFIAYPVGKNLRLGKTVAILVLRSVMSMRLAVSIGLS